MVFRLTADLLIVAHFGYVAFVVLGGLLVLRRPRLAWVHAPCAVWGALVEFAGWICPITPLEVALRERGGESAYGGDFVAHYLIPVLYPAALTRTVQIALGTLVVALNAVMYVRLAWRQRAVRSGGREE
jgi:hypothetical protein